MAKVPYGVETLPKISIVWVGRTNVTDDRQTDDRRQTDGRTVTYSEHELEFTFAKNHLLLTRICINNRLAQISIDVKSFCTFRLLHVNPEIMVLHADCFNTVWRVGLNATVTRMPLRTVNNHTWYNPTIKPYYPTAKYRPTSSHVNFVESLSDKSGPMSCKSTQMGTGALLNQLCTCVNADNNTGLLWNVNCPLTNSEDGLRSLQRTKDYTQIWIWTERTCNMKRVSAAEHRYPWRVSHEMMSASSDCIVQRWP